MVWCSVVHAPSSTGDAGKQCAAAAVGTTVELIRAPKHSTHNGYEMVAFLVTQKMAQRKRARPPRQLLYVAAPCFLRQQRCGNVSMQKVILTASILSRRTSSSPKPSESPVTWRVPSSTTTASTAKRPQRTAPIFVSNQNNKAFYSAVIHGYASGKRYRNVVRCGLTTTVARVLQHHPQHRGLRWYCSCPADREEYVALMPGIRRS